MTFLRSIASLQVCYLPLWGVLATTSPAYADTDSDRIGAAELVTKVLEGRSYIRSGIFAIQSSVFKKGRMPARFETTHTLFMTENFVRWDSEVPMFHSDSGTNQLARRISCQNCEGGYFFTYDSRNTSNGVPISAYLRKGELVNPKRAECIDIRSIGLFPAEIINLRHFRHELFQEQLQFAEVRHSQQMIELVVPEDRTGLGRTITVDPHKGYTVIKCESEYNHDGQRIHESADVGWKESSPGIWTPQRVYFTQKIDGEIHASELATIESRFVNSELQPELFTLDGMDLPEGLTVVRIDQLGTPPTIATWSDGQLLNQETTDESPPSTPVATSPISHLIILMNLGALIAIASVLFARRRLKRGE